MNTKEVRNHPEECSSSSTLQLFSIIASAPDSLKHSIIPCMLRGHPVDSLLDTGASENFISDRIVNAGGLIPNGKRSLVNMVSSELSAIILGRVTSDFDVQGRTYKILSFGVISNLCADVVLGQSFLNKHSEVLLKLEGTQKRLVIDNKSYCGVSASNFGGRRLFQNLPPDYKPIATKSKKFNDYDKIFIKNERSHLLKEGIIEPSLSPWRAQVLVTKDERHKRRMVVDYSQTIKRYTLLDAYPLSKIDEIIAQIAKGSVYSTLDLKSATTKYRYLRKIARTPPLKLAESCINILDYLLA